MNLKVLLICGLALLSVSGFSQGEWRLVYANDAQGKPTFGEIAELLEAVRTGKDIKVGWKMGGGDRFVEHTAEAQFLTIMDSVVYVQITPIIGQQPSFKDEQITFHEDLQWSMIAGTNGKNDTLMKDVNTGTILDHSIYRWATQWFVRN